MSVWRTGSCSFLFPHRAKGHSKGSCPLLPSTRVHRTRVWLHGADRQVIHSWWVVRFVSQPIKKYKIMIFP